MGKFDDFIDLEEVDHEDGINIYLLGLFETLQPSKLHFWIDGTIRRVHYKSCPSTIIFKKEVLSQSMSFLVIS